MSQQSVLDVQDLYVTFHQDKKSAELVKGVSFSVAPGEQFFRSARGVSRHSR
ncbi:putative uncharacterized protein [Sutterella wadsworthensis CAG:135]|nr:putative uncharacterized protein [Sutterella wadsworthensis CAG:135]